MRNVREFRLRELACEHRMTAVRCGLASVIPLQLLSILTAQDLDLRVCGLPDVDLEYLKVGRHFLIRFCHSKLRAQEVISLSPFPAETHHVPSGPHGDRQTRAVLLERTRKLF